MAFRNYIFIFISIILFLFLTLQSQNNWITLGWLKNAVRIASVVSIIGMLLAVILFPGLHSIPTTGENLVSSETIQLTDESRIESFLDDGSFRKISMWVYYPTNIEKGQKNCPLVVFSHGGISTSSSNDSLFQELASHGYIVASISHTYHALSTKIDNKTIRIDPGYMSELNQEDSYIDTKNSFQCYKKWMELRMSDINFVIDSFVTENINLDSTLTGLVNKEKIAVMGHSLGGSAALGIAHQRGDITAVIALESPFMYDIIGYNDNDFIWNTEPYSCAIMNIYSDSGFPLIEDDNKYVQNKNYLYNNEGVEYLYIEGSNHFSLTDLVRTSPILCALLGGGFYEKSGFDTLTTINEHCLEFLNKYLL